MSSILFLDLDGVANDHSKHTGSNFCGIRADCMARLNRIIKETGCKLVISSAWRYMVLGEQMTLKGFAYLLQTHGLLGTSDVLLGHTASDEEIPERVNQILSWLFWNNRMGDSWAVLDDLPIDFGTHHHRFVQTDGKAGLTDADADRVIAILGKENS